MKDVTQATAKGGGVEVGRGVIDIPDIRLSIASKDDQKCDNRNKNCPFEESDSGQWPGQNNTS
jgi:hypothetical protein